MRKFTKESTTYFAKGTVCEDGMFRRCDQNRVNMCGKQRVSSQQLERLWRATLKEHAQEVWERNWMYLEMQTTLLNTYPSKLIATILKELREQLKENDECS